MFFYQCEEANSPYNYVTREATFTNRNFPELELTNDFVQEEPLSRILYDLVFPPNSFQTFKINNEQDILDLGMTFPGVFNMRDSSLWQTDDLDYPTKRMKYTERVNVYFLKREPTNEWGYPAQFHNWWVPTQYKLK